MKVSLGFNYFLCLNILGQKLNYCFLTFHHKATIVLFGFYLLLKHIL